MWEEAQQQIILRGKAKGHKLENKDQYSNRYPLTGNSYAVSVVQPCVDGFGIANILVKKLCGNAAHIFKKEKIR